MKYTFVLEGLDCPNCAAAIEQEVCALEPVQHSSVNLLKQTLIVQAEESQVEGLFPQIEQIVHKHEPKVKVLAKSTQASPKNPQIDRKKVLRFSIGAVIFLLGVLLHHSLHFISLGLFLIAYLLLGYDVIFRAIRSICKGNVFNEWFLMSVSTIGAFCIGEYAEGVAVMLFYQIGELLQETAVGRSRHSISALLDIRQDTAELLQDGKAETVPADTVCVGDCLLIRAGERIPLDGVITEGSSFLNTAALTGEAVPRKVSPGDSVLSGCINQNGVLKIRVTKPFQESTASKIVELTEQAAERKAPTERFISKFARYYTPAVVGAAVLLAILPPLLLNGAWSEWLHRALVFLVISCPCALVISVPLTIFGGIGAASRHGVLVKGGNDLEALSHVRTIVMDKTGTLTKGEFRVTELFPAEPFTREQLLEYAARCEQLSEHPIARSICAAYGKALPEYANCTELSGYGIRCEGAGILTLAGNAALMEQQQIRYTPCPASGTKVYIAVNGQFCGCIVIADTLKPDCASAIEALRKQGITKTVMLTGDNAETANAIAKELGLDQVYAQLLPEDKVKYVTKLKAEQKKGEKLAFVGDGINDAPVLVHADVGIAMGALGSDAAIEAADVVLMTDAIGKLPEAITIARKTRHIVLQNILLSLGIKAILLVLGALGIAGMWLAVFGDVGVTLLAVLNASRMLKK